MEKRETFSSRLGFLLISAGCAIGLGNVWRFPRGVRFYVSYALHLRDGVLEPVRSHAVQVMGAGVNWEKALDKNYVKV